MIVLRQLFVFLEEDQAVRFKICCLLDDHVVARHGVVHPDATAIVVVLLAEHAARARVHCSHLVTASHAGAHVVELTT